MAAPAPDYIARKIADSLTIDGNIDKPAWRRAVWTRRFTDMVSGAPGLYDTRAAILWNDENLYVAFNAEEPNVEARLIERDSIVFLENDLELFIDGGDYDRSDASFWKGTHPRGIRWAFTNFDLSGLRTAVRVDGTLNDAGDIDKGWNLELAIPWTSLSLLANGRSLPLRGGDVWSLFLGRFQKLVLNGKEIQPHPALCLSPHGVYDTHMPEKWSRVAFAE